MRASRKQLTVETLGAVADLVWRLPLFARSVEMIASLRDNRVVSLATSTGTGKSTIFPILLIAAGVATRVAVTQPRRMARFVAAQFGAKMCGFEMAGKAHQPSAPVVYMTDGLLRARLAKKSVTTCFDVVMLDEIHERGVQSDLCVALMAQHMVAGAIDSKLVLCSATLDPSVLAPFKATGAAAALGVVENSVTVASPFRVTVDTDFVGAHAVSAVVECAKRAKRGEQVLCFLPSSADVRVAVQVCATQHSLIAKPLVSGRHIDERELNETKVFFSTTVAETSITLPHLAFVVDSGRIVVPRFNIDDRVVRLTPVNAPRSTLTQRRGRLGRSRNGVYVPLYDDAAVQRPEFATPKIRDSDLLRHEFALRVGLQQDDVLETMASDMMPSWTLGSAAFGERLKDTASMFELLREGARVASLASLINCNAAPQLNSPRWQAALHAAMTEFECGGDVLRLAVLASMRVACCRRRRVAGERWRQPAATCRCCCA